MTEQIQKFVPAVQNTTRILRLLSENSGAMGATQIARETGLNVSSAFNILRTLTHEGMLSFDEATKTYRIGLGMLEFATPLLAANPTDLIRPLISEIAHRNNVVIALYNVTPRKRIVLTDSVAAPNVIHAVIPKGSRFPIFAGGIGRYYVSRMNLNEKAAEKGYNKVRWQNPPGFEVYWREAQEARQQGYGRDRGNLTHGIEIVSCIIFDAENTPRIGISSITLTGQNDDNCLEKVGAELADARALIERALFRNGNLQEEASTKAEVESDSLKISS